MFRSPPARRTVEPVKLILVPHCVQLVSHVYNSLLLRLGGILRAIARTAFSRNRVPKVILRVSWLQSAIHLLRIVLHTHSYGESITTTAKVIRWWTRARYLIVVAIAGFLSARCDIVDPNAERAESRQGRGSTISVELVDEIDVVELISDFSDLDLGFDVQYPVATYSIVYQTIDANGDSTQASGALSMPNISLTSLPVVSYQHGTVTRREDVPSSSAKERIVGVAFAATGYFAVMPDYLGLGASPGMHPYVHAATSATAVVDRAFCKTLESGCFCLKMRFPKIGGWSGRFDCSAGADGGFYRP